MKKTALLTKLLCVLLVLMMIAAMAVSCHTEEDDASAATGDTSTTVPLEEDTEFPEDGLNDINFGESVRIVVSESQKGQVYQEEETDNVINNAIYKRGVTVEERLGLDITWIPMDATWNNNREIFFQHIQTTSETGQAYDALCLYNLMPGALAAKGLLENLADTTYIDLTAPWWPEDLVNQVLINDKLYSLVESSSKGTLMNIHGVFFNNKLINSYDLRSPYDMVEANEWTFENMIALVKGVGSDLNENGTKDKDDFFGVVTGTEAKLETWFFGMGYKYATRNEAGELEFLMNDSEYMLSWIDEFVNASDSKDFWLWDKEGHTKAFFNEHAILYMSAIRLVDNGVREGVEMDYGIVPVPKKDASQPKYITNVANSHDMWCVPLDAKDMDVSSAILECMASESYRQIAPVYFDQCIKLRFAPDERLAAMYDLIRDSIVFDFCAIYSFALPQVPRTVLHATLKNPSGKPWTSEWQKIEGSMVGGFETILELYR